MSFMFHFAAQASSSTLNLMSSVMDPVLSFYPVDIDLANKIFLQLK